MKITPTQRVAIANLVDSLAGMYNREQCEIALKQWARNSAAWRFVQQGGTGQLRLVCWYIFTHQPGSSEWRPTIILQAALAQVGLPYSVAVFLQDSIGSSVPSTTLQEELADNKQIQDELIIPYRPAQFYYGKIATRLTRDVIVDSHI